LSIFTKLCPQCSDSVESSAARCPCGYIFDTTTDGSICAGDLLEQNERMYLEYLEARVIQAKQDFEVARSAAARDPENRLATAELLRAEQVMNNARAELSSQSVRLETTRAVVTRSRPTPAPKPIIAPPPPEPLAPTAATRAPAPIQEISRAPQTAPAPKLSETLAMKKPEPAAAQPLAGLKLAVPEKPPAPETKPARRTFSVPASAKRVEPGESFRAAQAAKAERAMRTRTETPRAVPLPPKVTPAKPRSTDPLASAKAAMQVRHAAAPETRECPNCTAHLKLDVLRCRCGYEFPTVGAEIPALSLPSADLAALSANLSLGPLNRNR